MACMLVHLRCRDCHTCQCLTYKPSHLQEGATVKQLYAAGNLQQGDVQRVRNGAAKAQGAGRCRCLVRGTAGGGSVIQNPPELRQRHKSWCPPQCALAETEGWGQYSLSAGGVKSTV